MHRKGAIPARKVYDHDVQNYSNPRLVHNSIGNIPYIHIANYVWFLFVCGNSQAIPLIAAAYLTRYFQEVRWDGGQCKQMLAPGPTTRAGSIEDWHRMPMDTVTMHMQALAPTSPHRKC